MWHRGGSEPQPQLWVLVQHLWMRPLQQREFDGQGKEINEKSTVWCWWGGMEWDCGEGGEVMEGLLQCWHYTTAFPAIIHALPCPVPCSCCSQRSGIENKESTARSEGQHVQSAIIQGHCWAVVCEAALFVERSGGGCEKQGFKFSGFTQTHLLLVLLCEISHPHFGC